MNARAVFLRTASHPVHLVLGLSGWAVWLSVVYGGLSVACAVAPPDPAQGPWNWVNGALLGFTVATVVVLALAAWSSVQAVRRLPADARPGARERFLATGAAALYATAAACTAAVGVPLLLMAPCL